ncbi:MAG: sterol desaturase family protein [Pseudomonadales bacterium]
MIESLHDTVLTHGLLQAWLAIFAILSARYLVIAGAAAVIWYGWRRRHAFSRKIQQRWPRFADYRREVGYSFLTFTIFAAIATLVLAGPLRPYTQIYSNVADHGWGYFAASLVAVLLLHDAYFYWVHRAMHHPSVYRWVHLTHHRSTNPTPLAAFAFHPLEAGVIVLIAFLFPVHPGVILLFVLIMTLDNVYGHLGWELYPKGFQRHPIGRWINTSVSHNQHHRHAAGNYGLYFLWWDRMCGTLRTDYDAAFDEVTSRDAAGPLPAA